MPRKPDTDILMALIREHFVPELQAAVTFTRWKDGINLEYPRYCIEVFVDAVAANADKLFVREGPKP